MQEDCIHKIDDQKKEFKKQNSHLLFKNTELFVK